MALDLSRLKRCDQQWHAMQPTARGRLCAACSREIVDFRGLSGSEIARIHASSPTGVCGVYTDAQRAGRTEVLAAAALALVTLLPGTAKALPVVTPDLEPASLARPQASDTLWLRGAVIDSATRRPLRGVVVVNVDTNHGAVTDSIGRFRLVVDPAIERIRIRVMLIGYGASELDIVRADVTREHEIELSPQHLDMIAFYITGEPERPSLLRRFWRFITRSE